MQASPKCGSIITILYGRRQFSLAKNLDLLEADGPGGAALYQWRGINSFRPASSNGCKGLKVVFTW